MRKTISLLLILVLVFGSISYSFAAGDAAFEAAEALRELGLFQGKGFNSDGTPIYALQAAPTRNEAVTMLVRLLGKDSEAKAGTWETPFTDVANWAKPYVGYAYAHGLANGTGATTFGGDKLVTASQYLTFVLRALGYESGKDFKWNAAWELSDKLGLTNGEYNAANNNTFLRGNVTQISLSALNICMKSSNKKLIETLVDAGAVSGKAAASQGFDIYDLTDNVHFLYDIRTFTLFAFMNFTGYDDNNGRPITGTRRSIREELASKGLSLSSPRYYAEKNVPSHVYANALAQMGAAPDFRYAASSSDSSVQMLSDLPDKLKEFYNAAGIPALYEKYRNDHEKVLDLYKTSLPCIVEMVSYFDAQDIVESEFGVEVVLQDAYNRGSGLGLTEAYYGYGVIRTGPSDDINTLNIVHEYCHGFVNRTLDANAGKMNSLSSYYIPDCNAVTRQGYNSWTSIAYESFVRGISTYFTDNLTQKEKDQIIEKDVNDGFVMAKYVYERVPAFSSFNGSFSAFVNKLLAEYPKYAK